MLDEDKFASCATTEIERDITIRKETQQSAETVEGVMSR